MGRNRVVAVEVERLYISDGDWVEIKKRLNNGEQKRLEAAGLKPPILIAGKIISPIDWAVHDLERALIFILNWSISGPEGVTLPLGMDSLKAIDPETFEEINKVIIQFTTEQAKLRAEEKNAQSRAKTEEPKTTASPDSETTST